MSFNGTGTFLINSSGQPVVTGTTISSTAFNALTADLGTGLTTCLTKDGQSTPTGNIKMGAFKLTNVGVATTTGDALSYGNTATLGATTLSSTLGVTGAATLSSTLGVTGATTLSSTLGVTGVATFTTTVNLPNSASISTTGRYVSETATGGASLGLHNNLTSNNGILSVESTADGVRAAEFMASSQVSSGQIAIMIRNDTQTSYAIYFRYGVSTGVGSITFTSTATAYNTSSDGRMKIDRSTYDPGDLFDRINVQNFTWAHTGTPGLGIIAQELAEICPGWVTPGDDGDGKPGDEGYRMWQTPITEPLAAIMAELKSLRARVAILEAK
jgi:hypothetical protein